ncbi:MAG: hypothetical protein H5U17_15835 [Defluviimonas sp.]|jgi:hypothetical protein|nr:hypothetical protein [Defluviimonas sp.]
MTRFQLLFLVAVGLSACVAKPPVKAPDPVVSNDPGRNACETLAKAQGLSVSSVTGPTALTSTGATYDVAVNGGKGTTCTYSYLTSSPSLAKS